MIKVQYTFECDIDGCDSSAESVAPLGKNPIKYLPENWVMIASLENPERVRCPRTECETAAEGILTAEAEAKAARRAELERTKEERAAARKARSAAKKAKRADKLRREAPGRPEVAPKPLDPEATPDT